MNILLTGTTGFIGSKFLAKESAHNFRVVSRAKNECVESDVNCFYIKKLSSAIDWSGAFTKIDVVVHMAAMVHTTDLNLKDNLFDYREVNCNATLHLARSAVQSGVSRFIYISTINVNEVLNKSGCIESPSTQDAYAFSKLQAEIGLRKIAEETGLEVVIIRPPLVYGANAPGNFGKLFDLAKKNLPLPLGAINNMRSLVGIDNLVDLIAVCIDHPKAANNTFLVSDDHDVSTSDLLKSMVVATGKKPRLIPIPLTVLRFFAGLLGKSSVIDRMSSNLQVDISHTKDTLGWQPPVSFEEGIHRCFK